MSKPNILFLDIETAPGTAYYWSLWDSNIPIDRLISPTRMLCAAFKWNTSKDMFFVSEWSHGRKAMLEIVKNALDQADAVVTYNGDKFDFARLAGEFVAEGIRPPGPVTSIDIYKTVKKLGYPSGKLEFVADFLEIGKKVKHSGFSLWRDVLAGDLRAQGRMMEYNIGDVRLMEKLYKKLVPYMPNHPHLRDRVGCPNCGSNKVQHRGFRRTRKFKTQKLKCMSCGAWHSGARSKV